MHEYCGSLESLRIKDSDKSSMCFRVVGLIGFCFSWLIIDSCMFYYWCLCPPESKHLTPACPLESKTQIKAIVTNLAADKLIMQTLELMSRPTRIKYSDKSSRNKSCNCQTSGQLEPINLPQSNQLPAGTGNRASVHQRLAGTGRSAASRYLT